MKNLYALVIGISISLAGTSQSCLPEGIAFTTQAQVDSFQIDYPNCTEIAGDVRIQGSDITNLNGLSVLTSIGGSLSIRYNDLLSNLTGLNNLMQIGSLLSIEYNDSLKNINSLINLTDIGTFIYIQGNSALTSLNGLEGITTIERLEIWNNDRLTSLTGLDNLISVNGWLTVYHNDSLVNFSGLNQLDSIGGQLSISFNAGLTSIKGLEGLTYIGSSLVIRYNDNLNNLEGLDKLTYIRLGLFIEHNPNLTNLSNLINLNTVKHAVWIENNDILESLSGLDSLDYSVFDSLYICNNTTLSECHIQSVCDYLSHFAYFTVINNNAVGCNSIPEVKEACWAYMDDLQFGGHMTRVEIYPNPSTGLIYIDVHGNSSRSQSSRVPGSQFQMSMFDFQGRQIIRQQITEEQSMVDISGLAQGVYFVQVANDHFVKIGKFVKK